MDKEHLTITFNMVCNELVKHQFKNLFAISRGTDSDRAMIFELLGFQIVKIITCFAIFNIKFKHVGRPVPDVIL